MFSGETIVMQKEVLQPDRPFLIRNGALPWAHQSFEIPLITRATEPSRVAKIADEIFEQVAQLINTKSPHEIRFVYKRTWQPANGKDTRAAILQICEDQYKRIKAFDVSREMFRARGDAHARLLPIQKNPSDVVDILFGESTRFGDGQRHYDGAGQWSFSQQKGLRAHTGHFYIRGAR